jgi:hypothetical protein
VHSVSGRWLLAGGLLAAVLVSCGDEPSLGVASPEVTEPPAPPPLREVPEALEEPAPTEPAQTEPATTEPTGTIEASPILYGDVRDVTDDVGADLYFRALLVEEPAPVRPTSAPIGYVLVHVGAWELRLVEEVPVPHTTASVVDWEGHMCVAQVRRARRFHAVMIEEEADSSPAQTGFLALELRRCPRGEVGVAGVSVTTHRLGHEPMEPARPELVALVTELDRDERTPPPLYRALELRDRELAVVIGNATWVIHRERVLVERFGGQVQLLIEAGPRTLFSMANASDSWTAALEDFVPPRADGSPSRLCSVVDPSGTPLNVRAEAGVRTAVIGALDDGAIVDVLETRGPWRRVDAEVDGWVHAESLRCD